MEIFDRYLIADILNIFICGCVLIIYIRKPKEFRTAKFCFTFYTIAMAWALFGICLSDLDPHRLFTPIASIILIVVSQGCIAKLYELASATENSKL